MGLLGRSSSRQRVVDNQKSLYGSFWFVLLLKIIVFFLPKVRGLIMVETPVRNTIRAIKFDHLPARREIG